MNGEVNLLTLISLIIAVVVILRLRSVLGRRTPDDDARIVQRRRSADLQKTQGGAAPADSNVVTLPRRGRDTEAEPIASQTPSPTSSEIEERMRLLARGNAPLAEGLIDITERDSAFDPEHFLRGGRQAYEMIVTAFADGNRRTLRNLLAPDVYEGFNRAITEREARGEKIAQSFVGISSADMLEAEVTTKGIANITVRFVSQLISSTQDRAGNVIEGDSQRVKDVTDIWTFSRDVSSKEARRDLNWKLAGTQAPN